MKYEVGMKLLDEHQRVLEVVEINPEFEECYVVSYKYNGDWVVSEYSEVELDKLKIIE